MKIVIVVLAISIVVVLTLVFLTRPKKLVHLPILTPHNANEFPEWHAYYEKVYGCSVESEVDLNEFTWFYNFSPLGKKRKSIAKYMSPPTIGMDVPWIGELGPEKMVEEHGFFVRRRGEIQWSDKMEVIRVNTTSSIWDEDTLIWFYGVRGSGIFIDVPKSCAVVKDQFDAGRILGKEWPMWKEEWGEYEHIVLPGLLKEKGVEMLVLKDASAPHSPRVEVIVPNKSVGGSIETCPDLKLWTEAEGRRECPCSNQKTILNCDGTH